MKVKKIAGENITTALVVMSFCGRDLRVALTEDGKMHKRTTGHTEGKYTVGPPCSSGGSGTPGKGISRLQGAVLHMLHR